MANFSNVIGTAVQLHQAETATYLTDAIIGIVFIIVFLIVANLISWQPGAHDSSPAKRKAAFWIMTVVTLFVCLLVNYFVWMTNIKKTQFQNEYLIHMIVASVVGTLVFCLVTFLICKLQKKDTKLASVFR